MGEASYFFGDSIVIFMRCEKLVSLAVLERYQLELLSNSSVFYAWRLDSIPEVLSESLKVQYIAMSTYAWCVCVCMCVCLCMCICMCVCVCVRGVCGRGGEGEYD